MALRLSRLSRRSHDWLKRRKKEAERAGLPLRSVIRWANGFRDVAAPAACSRDPLVRRRCRRLGWWSGSLVLPHDPARGVNVSAPEIGLTYLLVTVPVSLLVENAYHWLILLLIPVPVSQRLICSRLNSMLYRVVFHKVATHPTINADQQK